MFVTTIPILVDHVYSIRLVCVHASSQRACTPKWSGFSYSLSMVGPASFGFQANAVMNGGIISYGHVMNTRS